MILRASENGEIVSYIEDEVRLTVTIYGHGALISKEFHHITSTPPNWMFLPCDAR